MVMQMLTDWMISAYRKWALMFQEQVNLRDKCSLAYHGKVLVAENMDLKGYLRQHCKVMQGPANRAGKADCGHEHGSSGGLPGGCPAEVHGHQ
jgi:hypothetical protein